MCGEHPRALEHVSLLHFVAELWAVVADRYRYRYPFLFLFLFLSDSVPGVLEEH